MSLFQIVLFSAAIPLCVIMIISSFASPELSPVYGHAIPDSYTLEPNAILENYQLFPSSVSIVFSERPDPKASYIHVIDSEGRRIDNDDYKITGEYDREATVSVDKSLIRDGVYSVSWLTLSLDDGHVSKGTYVVGVGNSVALTGMTKNVTADITVSSPMLGIAKVPIVLGQTYILGFVVPQIFIWKDIHRRGMRNIVDSILIRRFSMPIIVCSIAMGVGASLIPIFQSILISENLSEYMNNLAIVYFETSNGLVWLIRVISCAIIALAAYYYRRMVINDTVNGFSSTTSRTKETIILFILLISISIFVATNSFTSHSSAIATWSQLGILADFAHSVAVSIWIGGLMYILFVLFPNVITISKNISGKAQQFMTQPRSVLLLILSRFSVVSTICVGVVGITGLTLAWLHIQNMDELLISEYGRILIVKLSLVLPIIILGGYHQFWISKITKVFNFEGEKESESSNTRFSDSFTSLKRTVMIECILAASVLCVASFLTVTTPPGAMQNNEDIKVIPSGEMTSKNQDEFIRTLETQGMPINLVISPFVSGFNNFTINIPGINENIGQVSNVSMELRKTDLSLGPIFAQLARINETAYSAYGGYLSQAGEWDLKVTIKRTNLYDLNYRVSFTVNKSGDSMHQQHNVRTVEIQNASSQQSSFTPMVIGLSAIVAALSTYFCISALKRLKIIQQKLGLEN